jgi:hypothetical protein
MINFTCRGCGANLEIADNLAGRPAGCPFCGILQRVPGEVRRPSRIKILFRFWLIPLLFSSFWLLLFPPLGFAMLAALAGLTVFLWLLAHAIWFCMGPRQYFRDTGRGRSGVSLQEVRAEVG